MSTAVRYYFGECLVFQYRKGLEQGSRARTGAWDLAGAIDYIADHLLKNLYTTLPPRSSG